MSDQLFGAKAPAPGSDQATEVDVDSVKARFSKEDGTVDVDALLKAKAHADKHIAKVEAEHAETKADRDRRLTYEDMISKINANRDSTSRTPPQEETEREVDPTQVIPEDLISKKVDEMLTKKQQEARRVDNVAYAAQELTKVWGEDYTDKLLNRAKELNLSQDFLRDLARENPQGFLKIVVPSAPKAVERSFTPPQSSQRAYTQSEDTGVRNWAYYQKIKKSDPERYKSGEIAVEMDRQAQKLGDAFYK